MPGERAVTELLHGAAERVRGLLIEDGATFEELEAEAARLGVPVERRRREDLEKLVGPGVARRVVARATASVWGISCLVWRRLHA